MAGFYAKKYEGLDLTREEVEERLEGLLAHELAMILRTQFPEDTAALVRMVVLELEEGLREIREELESKDSLTGREFYQAMVRIGSLQRRRYAIHEFVGAQKNPRWQ